MIKQILFLIILITNWSAHAIDDDFCPRIEGVDLQCAPVKPLPGGGGGGGGGLPICAPTCEPGYNCPDGFGGGGGGGGDGEGSGPGDGGTVPNPPQPVECTDQPTICYYVRTGSVRTVDVTSTATKVVGYECKETPGSGETPPTFNLVSLKQSCKNVSTTTCYNDADRTTAPGIRNTCTGVTCPVITGFTRVTSSVPCPISPIVTLPLCSSLVTPPPPPCPATGGI